MAQVIHVRFMNPSNSETVHENFTLASTHEEAINLAMGEFSHGIGVIKSTEQVGEVQHILSGINSCWRYVYACTIEDDEYDREMWAILDAQYPERRDMKNVAVS